MVGLLRDILDSLGQRIRSPILGSLLICAVAFNCKPLWVLFLTDAPITYKFLFFDENTSAQTLYVMPLAVGGLLAILMPNVRYFGALMASYADANLKKLQHDQVRKHQIYGLSVEIEKVRARAELDAAIETVKIEQAQRLREAEEIGGDALKAEIEETRKGK